MVQSLWPERWPAIALQECVDKVEAAEPATRNEVRMNLPCKTCPEAVRCLTAKRKEIGSLLYDREILTNPRSSESSLFPRELFEPMLLKDRDQVPSWRKPSGIEERFKVVQAWDFAWSEKVGGDWLVCITAFIDLRTGVRQVLEIKRWQRKTFDEQCQLVEEQWQRFGADLVVFETAAAQRVWYQHIKRTKPLVPVMPHSADEKRDFRSGVPGLLIELENGVWRFPYRQGGYNFAEMQNFLNECEAFSMIDGKLEGVGEHDDTVMCWWHLSWGMSYLGLAHR